MPAGWGALCGLGAYFWVLGLFGCVPFTFTYLLIVLVLGYLAGVAAAVVASGHEVRFFRSGRRW